MRLKLFTTVCIALGMMLLISASVVLGPVPHKGTPKVLATSYAKRSVAYLCGLLVTFTSSAVGAILIVRRQREEYRQEILNNVQHLVESYSSAKPADTDRREAE